VSRRDDVPSVFAPLREVAAGIAPENLRLGARALSRSLGVLGRDEHIRLLILAGGIGLAAAFAVTLFYRTIDFIQEFTLRRTEAAGPWAWIAIPVIVTCGFAISRLLVRWGANDSPGENIPDLMYRLHLKGGRMPLRPVAAKAVASAVLIGTGGAVGAEGPVIVAGAATGSRIGRWLKSSPQRLRTLAGCGAAAGLSAAFNAPIAGVLFAVEKILGSAGGLSLGPFVVASIIASTFGRSVFGNQPVLAVPSAYSLISAWHLLLYTFLGTVSGFLAVAYTRMVWATDERWEKFRQPWTGVLVGGLIVGSLSLVFRADLWGHGHQSVDLFTLSSRSVPILLGLVFAKLVATAVTVATGRAGGLFTPALFLGAALGTAFGILLQPLPEPWGMVPPGAFALAGMAAVVAGATHAPLTAIMMVFEMTGDYGLILPLMLTSVVAYLVARKLHPESVYTEWLVRRGIVLTHGADAALLVRVTVGEGAISRAATVAPDVTLTDILGLMEREPQELYPVVSRAGQLLGSLTPEQARQAALEKPDAGASLTAAQLMRTDPEKVRSEETLLDVLRRMVGKDLRVLPAVSADDSSRYIGVVTRAALFREYDRLRLADHP